MKFYETYKEELNNLLIDESNISFFCDLIKDNIRYSSNDCLEMLKFVINFCEDNHLEEAAAWMYYYLAWNYSDSSDFEKAIEIFEKAKEIFEKHDNKKGVAYIYNGLTSIYCQSGQFELSNEIGLRGISIAREIAGDDILLKILMNISMTNMQNKSYEAAKEILSYIEANYNYVKLSSMNNIIYNKSMAEVELNIGDPNNALELIEQALKIDKDIGISIFTTEGHKLLAMAYAKLGRIKEADEEFRYSADIALENSNTLEYCETLLEWSIFKINIGEDEKAMEFLRNLAKVAEENKFNMLLKNSSKLLYNHYKEINDYEKALRNLEKYMYADKEINNYKNLRLIAKLNVEHGDEEINFYKFLHDKTELLFNIGQEIISDLDVDTMVLYINKEIGKLIKSDYFAIALYNEETDEIIHRTVINGKIIVTNPVKLGDKKTLAEYCIRNKKTIFINDFKIESKKYVKEVTLVNDEVQEPLSNISIPLLINDEIIAVMSIQSMKENSYESHDVNTLKILGNYAAIALKNASEYKKMEQVAIYDSLTGFLTKREIIKEGNALRDEFINSPKSFCILMIDMDDFKRVNDTHGHIAGDAVIKMVTQTIGKLIRHTDYIGRYGGDEFLLVCPGMYKKSALKMAEKIRAAVESTDYIVNNNIVVKSTISIGVYEFNEAELSFTEGINLADLTMYKAKNNKKNNVMGFENMNLQ